MELARAKESESNPRTKENTNHEKNSKKNYYPIKVFYGEIKVKKISGRHDRKYLDINAFEISDETIFN